MHELKIIQDIFPSIEKLAKERNLAEVKKVILGVGKLHQAQGEFLRFAFSTISEGTIAEGAELIVEFLPIKLFCNSCKKHFSEHHHVCPDCAGVSLDVLAGKEVVLEDIK